MKFYIKISLYVCLFLLTHTLSARDTIYGVIKAEAGSLLPSTTVVQGKVITEQGDAIVGVNVTIKGTNRG